MIIYEQAITYNNDYLVIDIIFDSYLSYLRSLKPTTITDLIEVSSKSK